MNKRKRAKRRMERTLPNVILQAEYRPHYQDPAVYFIPAEDGNGRTVIVAVTRGQARKLGFSEGLVQREIAQAWKRIACTLTAASRRLKEVAGATGDSNPEPDSGAMHRDTGTPAAPLVTSHPDASHRLALTAPAETSLPDRAVVHDWVEVDIYLDGPRGHRAVLPGDWKERTPREREAFINHLKDSLLEDSVAFSVTWGLGMDPG